MIGEDGDSGEEGIDDLQWRRGLHQPRPAIGQARLQVRFSSCYEAVLHLSLSVLRENVGDQSEKRDFPSGVFLISDLR